MPFRHLLSSITGENKHYGTPLNTAAPDRVPGGSSSGSAAAVAAGIVDFALGTDPVRRSAEGSVLLVPSCDDGVFTLKGRGRLTAQPLRTCSECNIVGSLLPLWRVLG